MGLLKSAPWPGLVWRGGRMLKQDLADQFLTAMSPSYRIHKRHRPNYEKENTTVPLSQTFGEREHDQRHNYK